jgi:phosphatidylglycerophosphatase A
MELKRAKVTQAGNNARPALWVLILATVFGLGYAPVAPGTAGTAGAVVIYYLLFAARSWWAYVVIWLALLGLSFWAAQKVQDAQGRDDPQIVVIDEAVGYFAAMFLLPPTWGYMIAAFLIFRAFDVIKPFPASYFDKKVSNGVGIVMDDVAAGIYTNLVLQLFHLLWGQT